MDRIALITKLSLLRDYCKTSDFALIKAEEVQEAIDIIRAYEALHDFVKCIWPTELKGN